MLPTTGLVWDVLPTSTRMRKTRATKNREEVRRAKMKRVLVADLIALLEGCGVWTDGSSDEDEADSSFLFRGPRVDMKDGSAMCLFGMSVRIAGFEVGSGVRLR